MPEPKSKFHINFGALAPMLTDQLEKQNINVFDKKAIEQCQRDADALVRLHVRGIVTQSVSEILRAKIMKDIVRAVNKKPAD